MKNNVSLELTITTIDNEDNLKLAQFIADAWTKLGVKTEVLPIDKNVFFSQVVKPKNYTILLNSTMHQLNSDPYPYWDSSQVGEKGFNLSNYSNTKVDKLIEEARINNDINLRLANYQAFQKIICDDLPAIFIASPNYLYLQNKKIKGFTTKTVNSPDDIFYNAREWYLKEKKKMKF